MKHFNLIVALIAIGISLPATAYAQPRLVSAPAAADDDRPRIDVVSYEITAQLDPAQHRLSGSARIRFRQLDRKPFAVFDLERRLRVSDVLIGETRVRFRQTDIDSSLEIDLGGQQFSEETTLRIDYSGTLNPEEERTDAVLARVDEKSAFLLYDGKWFPTNGLYKDKADFRLTLSAPPEWKTVTDLGQSGTTMTSAAPGFWGTVASGAYTTIDVKGDKSAVALHTLHAAAEVAEPIGTSVARMLDFYSETFGALGNGPFQIVEVDGANWKSRSSGGALLLAASEIRKDVDAWPLARTVAEQWFPMKYAVANPSGDAWLGDGMANFASLYYFEKKASPTEFQEIIDKALVKALAYEGSTTIRQAGGLRRDSDEYQSLVVYKGGYVLRMLRWLITEETFDRLIAAYVRKFADSPVSTDAFTALASEVAGGDLGYFFDQWLNSSGVPEFSVEYTVFRLRSGYKVMGQIKQDLDLFKMPVEIQVITDGDPEYFRTEVQGPSSDYDLQAERKPKAIMIDPRKKILRMSNDIKVAVMINRGEELSNEGKFNPAIDEFQKAIDIDKSNSLALFRMGEALFELGNLQAAAGTFRESLNGDLKPKWVEVWAYINLGKIYDMRGQRDRAVTEYQKAVNTGDDAYGAQGEAQKHIQEPFRRTGRPTIGD